MGTSADRLLERLPGLYRPRPGGGDPLERLLAAAAAPLDDLRERAGEVLRGRWLTFADRRIYHPWADAVRRAAGRPPQTPNDLVELADPAAAAAALAQPATPLAGHLAAGFTQRTRALLAAHRPPAPPAAALARALVDELSARARGASLFDEERFAGVALPDEVRELAAAAPAGGALVALNLALLAAGTGGAVAAAAFDHPHLDDLARLAALVAPPPWQQPPALRETVEAYRLRVDRTVALYREGLGTRAALARAVEAALPVDPARPVEERDRPFAIEESAPLDLMLAPGATRGAPAGVLGPLMRWQVDGDGLGPVPPTVYVQGVKPEGDRIAATVDPVIELYSAGGAERRVGLAFRGTLAAGETLRLAPGHSSWLGLADGLLRARSRPAGDAPADPTAPGPWRRVEGVPAGEVTALAQTADRVLWAGLAEGAGGRLARFDGRAWSVAVDGLPAVRCLAEDGPRLLVGTDGGLRAVALHPAADEPFAAEPVAGLDGAVRALLDAAPEGGGFWVGGAGGVSRLAADGTVAGVGLTAAHGTATPIAAIARDPSGALYFGGELGLFEHQPASGRWHVFTGGERSDQRPEWRSLLPGGEGEFATLPAAATVFLPPVLAIHRGPDAALWLGTDRGAARYVARSSGGVTLDTVVEAFPDLTAGPVRAIAGDERGGVWLASDRGVLRYDGRDLWQPRGEGESWRRLGPAALLVVGGGATSRGAWRFDRGEGAWQRFAGDGWETTAATPRTTARSAVGALLWSDDVVAEIGRFDGVAFTADRGVADERLEVRFKPSEERIVAGGLPGLPRLPPGPSVWRSLRREPNEPVDLPLPRHRPGWTWEGRLLPEPRRAAPGEGRFDVAHPPPASAFDDAVFAYPPAARVWLSWRPRRPLGILVRLAEVAGEALDPAVLDRVWEIIDKVRPAGARVALAVGEEVVRDGRG